MFENDDVDLFQEKVNPDNNDQVWRIDVWQDLEIKKEILTSETKTKFKVRLTLDYIEDYWLLESVRRIAGNFSNREKVNKIFQNNPDMYLINWFRNVEWKNAQLNKSI